MPAPKDPENIKIWKQKLSDSAKNNPVKFWIGKERSEETRQKISRALKGNIPAFKGRHHTAESLRIMSDKSSKGLKDRPKSAEHKRKLRLKRLEQIERESGIVFPQIGLNETQLLDRQEEIDNCKILRQHRIRELGYFVDGYCPETNTVYEVYEAFHAKRSSHDIQRQKEIQDFLKCNFIILRDGL